jgi:hypothetical protein
LEKKTERRYTATNARGEHCRRYAIFGSNVCKTHGGATRQVVSTARMRVEMASNRLMGKLIEFAFDDDKPAHVQLEAIKDSLNRAGLKPREQLEVGPIKQYEEIFDDIFTGTRVESRRARGIEDDEAESIDYQGDSPPHPAMSTGAPNPVDYQRYSDGRDEMADIEYRESDSSGPASTHSGEAMPPRPPHRPRPQRRSAVHITGEDAIRVANQANFATGALRALPRGSE